MSIIKQHLPEGIFAWTVSSTVLSRIVCKMFNTHIHAETGLMLFWMQHSCVSLTGSNFFAVYGVLPCSLIFLTVFNKMAAEFSRRRMFNTIIVFFMGFIAIFSMALFPHANAIHPTSLCNALLERLPSGFSGSVAVISNWSYSLFYCAAELWGDVCLSLLFWSLANEMTSLKDAAVIYPLFGIGANVAQVCAGQVLKAVGASGSTGGYVPQMQALCSLVLVLGASILLLHEVICRRIAQAGLVAGGTAPDAAKRAQQPIGTSSKHQSGVNKVEMIQLNIKYEHEPSASRSVKVQIVPGAEGSSTYSPTTSPATAKSDCKPSTRDGFDKRSERKKTKKKAMSFAQALVYVSSDPMI